MDALKKLDLLLSQLYNTTNSIFVGLFYNENPVLYKSFSSEKEKGIAELLGLLVRKFIQSTDLIGSPEFMFTEGKGYAIFAYKVSEGVTLISVIDGKPNFSLLKLENEKVAKSIQEFSPQIPSILEELAKKEESEKQQKEKDEPVKEEPPLSKKAEEEEAKEEKQDTEEIKDDIKELEEIFSADISDIETTETPKESVPVEEPKVEEKVEEEPDVKETKKEKEQETEIVQEEQPSLEEILLEDEPVDKEVLDKISIKFVEEIGPVGKLLFKKSVQKLGIDIENPSRLKVEKLIDVLASEISVEKRREDFISFCRDLL